MTVLDPNSTRRRRGVAILAALLASILQLARIGAYSFAPSRQRNVAFQCHICPLDGMDLPHRGRASSSSTISMKRPNRVRRSTADPADGSPAPQLGNMNQNANQFDLLLTHTSFTKAPLVDISGMISVIIGAPRQSAIIIQGGKKVVMMPSPTMLSCFALVLACFTHANSLCNEEERALAFENEVQSFLSCMLLLTNACSSQKISYPKSALS